MKENGNYSHYDISLVQKETGMRGYTPLFDLLSFHYIENVGIDAMHNIVLGLVKLITIEVIETIVTSTTHVNTAKVI